MSLVERAFKKVGMTFPAMGWGSYGSGSTWTRVYLPGSKVDYVREVGELHKNVVVGIGVGWIARNFCEPRLVVARRKADGSIELDPENDLTALWARPNPFYDTETLGGGIVVDLLTAPLAMVYKGREGKRGPVRELHWLPYRCTEPVRSKTDFVKKYIYRPNGGDVREFGPEEVIPIRLETPDPADPQVSWPGLFSAQREIALVNRITNHNVRVLVNGAVGGFVLTPKDYMGRVNDTQKDEAKKKFEDQYTGDNVGKPIMLNGPMEASKIGFSPDELATHEMLGPAIEIICGAIGLNAMVLGLPSNSRTYSNFPEAERQAQVNCLVPLQKRVAKALTHFLLPEFSARPGEFVTWDWSTVQALQENRNEAAKQGTILFGGNVATLNEARARAGLPADPRPEFGEKYRFELVTAAAPTAQPADGSEPKALNGHAYALARRGSGGPDSFRSGDWWKS